jgi:hypothetical protein
MIVPAVYAERDVTSCSFTLKRKPCAQSERPIIISQARAKANQGSLANIVTVRRMRDGQRGAKELLTWRARGKGSAGSLAGVRLACGVSRWHCAVTSGHVGLA